MTLPGTNAQWIYAQKPEGSLGFEHFKKRQVTIPELAPGQVLVKVRALSVDPAQRMWMNMETYRPMLQPGEVMACYGIGEIVATNAQGFAIGDFVDGDFGWQEYAAMNPLDLVRRDGTQTLEHLIGVLNITGLTAYFGILKIGMPRPGETVVVSGAAGAVGCIAVQLAKLAGCYVVALAGGEKKCQWLKDEFGADATVDYKAGNVLQNLKAVCPNGIDVYFDNTAGEILDACLTLMNLAGRVVCCGAVSQYDGGGAKSQPQLPGVLIRKRIRMEGFIVFDHYGQRAQAEKNLINLIRNGKLKTPMDVIEGIDNAPQALIDLLAGKNTGKMMIRVS